MKKSKQLVICLLSVLLTGKAFSQTYRHVGSNDKNLYEGIMADTNYTYKKYFSEPIKDLQLSTIIPGEDGFKDRRYTFLNMDITTMLLKLYNIPSLSYSVNEIKDTVGINPYLSRKQRFVMDVIVPKGKENELTTVGAQLVGEKTGIQTRIEKRNVPVLVLKRTDGKLKIKKGSPHVKGFFAGGPVNMQFESRSIAIIASHLALAVKVPVIDETEMKGVYNFSIDYQNIDDLKQKLPAFGLELVEANREVDMVVLYR